MEMQFVSPGAHSSTRPAQPIWALKPLPSASMKNNEVEGDSLHIPLEQYPMQQSLVVTQAVVEQTQALLMQSAPQQSLDDAHLAPRMHVDVAFSLVVDMLNRANMIGAAACLAVSETICTGISETCLPPPVPPPNPAAASWSGTGFATHLSAEHSVPEGQLLHDIGLKQSPESEQLNPEAQLLIPEHAVAMHMLLEHLFSCCVQLESLSQGMAQCPLASHWNGAVHKLDALQLFATQLPLAEQMKLVSVQLLMSEHSVATHAPAEHLFNC
jgi:hypothetical protein